MPSIESVQSIQPFIPGEEDYKMSVGTWSRSDWLDLSAHSSRRAKGSKSSKCWRQLSSNWCSSGSELGWMAAHQEIEEFLAQILSED